MDLDQTEAPVGYWLVHLSKNTKNENQNTKISSNRKVQHEKRSKEICLHDEKNAIGW